MDVPIGKRLRLKEKKPASHDLAIDAQIAALEKELHNSSNSDSDSDSDNDSQADYLLVQEELDEYGKPAVLRSKSLLEDRITPLPASLLPSTTCGFSSGHNSGSKRPPAKVRFVESDQDKRSKTKIERVSDEAKIRELLKNYTPTSLDKRPFWCRICRYQGSSESDFYTHRVSDFHKKAAAIEAKMCTCRPCKKSFTSLEQMKEHCKGKIHKGRIEMLREHTSKAK